jgi:hypothetical protein
MGRSKVTITLDREKASNARILTGAESTSAVIDVALDRLIKTERLRLDIEAYRREPPTIAETLLPNTGHTADLADDTDWESLYPVDGR